MAYHVVFAAPQAGATVGPLSSVGVFSQESTVIVQRPVTAALAEDLANRAARSNRSQYRLQFDAENNNDGNVDYTTFGVVTLEMSVTYLSE